MKIKRKNRVPLRRDLGLQLFGLYLVFVGLVVVATLLFEFVARRRLEADINAANLALAHAVAEETNSTMHNALETVRHLAAYPEVIHAHIPGMEPLFRTLMHGRNDINLTYRLDANGIMLFHYPTEPESTVGNDFSFRDYFQEALTTREALVSKGRISPTTNQPVATAVMPIWQADQFLGVVATNIKLQSLSDTLASISGEYQASGAFQILIVDATGQIIAHSNPGSLLQNAHAQIPEVVTAVLDQQTGSRIARDASGSEQLYSYVPIREVGWGVIVSRPTAVAFASPTVFRRAAILSVLVFLIGGIIYWVILSRRVIRPIEQLAIFSQDVGLLGSYNADDEALVTAMTTRPDQMGVLTRSLQRMQQAIQARLNELSTLLQTSAAVVSSLDSNTVLDRILEQVELLLDVRMSAIFAPDEERDVFRVHASRHLP
ncbi:MAG: cache domain-containing protein, partial [Ardenticatenaceae bacterium]|nr:cache domain-containing protein [Ardenticatenaceae bacterium]